MIYDDGTGRRIYRRLRGRRRPREGAPEPGDAVREAIHRVGADHPRWGTQAGPRGASPHPARHTTRRGGDRHGGPAAYLAEPQEAPLVTRRRPGQ
jgi:hypothetical protein